MLRTSAFKFVAIIGVISLFADVTYEGARSTTGPFLAFLGASAASVGIIAGLGELIGYGLRFFSGYLSDVTKRYWTFMFMGYGVNLLAVPALAIAPNWQTASFFILLERLGKAIRTPARDVMLAHASRELGRGKGFGLHEALDRIGACLGPLVVAGMLFWRSDYRLGFAVLLIPAVIALSLLGLAWSFHSVSLSPTEEPVSHLERQQFGAHVWIFILAAGLLAAGFTDFPLIAFHFSKGTHLAQSWIPILYSIAMGVDAIAALILGSLFDRRGIMIVVLATLVTALFSIFAFSGGFYTTLLGVVLWGIGLGANESILKAAFSQLVPKNRLGTAFGIYNGVYGIAWFLGTATMGFLYEFSVAWLMAFSVITQLAAIPLLLIAYRGRYFLSNINVPKGKTAAT